MSEIKLREDYIKLGQALKAAGSVGSGVDAKFVIQDGRVKVNGETEYQRGKKLYDGDVITYEGMVACSYGHKIHKSSKLQKLQNTESGF